MKAVVLAACCLAILGALAWHRDSQTAPETLPEADHCHHAIRPHPEWEEIYSDASPVELRKEIDALQELLDSGSEDYFETQFAAGTYEVMGLYTRGVPYTFQPEHSELAEYRFLPDGQLAKVVLPEVEFPQSYELKERIEWLLRKEARTRSISGN